MLKHMAGLVASAAKDWMAVFRFFDVPNELGHRIVQCYLPSANIFE